MPTLTPPPVGTKLYEQVADRLSEMIEDGTLRSGDRIPSVRRLHRQWGVSISTVLAAYRVLEDRGLIAARAASGHYVRPRSRRLPEPRPSGGATPPRPVNMNDLMVRLTACANRPDIVALGCGLPHPDLIPTEALGRITASIARRRSDAHTYVVSPGHEKLRRAVAARMIDAGCALTPDDLVITSGAQEALNLALSVLCQPGDNVVVASPTYFGLLEVLAAHRLNAIEVPSHPSEGMDLGQLARVLRNETVSAVAVVPTFSNPLGSLMPADRKAQMVALCRSVGVPIVEDDVYGELAHRGPRPPALQSFDRHGEVLTCGSLSKTLSPGLRVGWMAPGRYRDAVIRRKLVASLAVATLPQLVAAEYLTTGGFDLHLRRLRKHNLATNQAMSAAISGWGVPGVHLTRPAGGTFLWVELPPSVDGTDLFERALARGIAVAPGAMFSPSGRHRHHVRLNTCVPWNARVQEAIATLGTLVSQAARTQTRG